MEINNEQKPLCELEEKIGYKFKNTNIVKEALTHSSYHNEMKSKGEKVPFNERLEFLGDSVLSIVVSTYIFEKFNNKQEGDLTKIRAAVVCEKALAKYSLEVGLGDYMYLGHGEIMNKGRTRPSIIADAFEALLAAIYIDSGESFDKVREFVIPLVSAEIKRISENGVFIDYKTALQQIVQQASGEILEYVLVDEFGPDHDKQFKVEARLNSNVIGKGCARTKREAEQQAAHEALVLFGEAEA
ncbi:MAG: ribonuclease III [Ruminococcaceae bacterium]|nr:ribonuclease III [Oscillospiraceae bacterium]